MRALLALLLLTATAAAEPAHVITYGGTVRALRTDSANALTEDSLAGGQLGYEHVLGLELVPKLSLWATGLFGWGFADGTMFRTLTTEISTFTFAAGGRARYPIFHWLHGTASLDLGTTRAAIGLRDDMSHTAADSGWGVITQGKIGLELLLAREQSRFKFGIRLELGYVATSPISLTATPESGSDGTTHALLHRRSPSGPRRERNAGG
jgi:hypothetical protein